MLNNFDSDEQSWPSKGKCLQIEHNLFDELWNFGDRKMPTEVKFSQEDAAGAEREEGADANADSEQGENKTQEESKEATEEDEVEDEHQGPQLTTLEWDLRVIEAFKRACFESL
jgi:hypothetical protein